MQRFWVCGEALIDLVGSGGADTRRSTWAALSAGGPMNTAIGLARLGGSVEFLARLGDDAFADQLRRHVTANGVGLSLAVDAAQPTSLAVVSLDAEGKASYTFHFSQTANFGWQPDELPEPDPDVWLHTGSIGTVVGPGARTLVDWAGAGTGPMSFDVNVRPTVLPDRAEYWERIEAWLRVVGARSGLVKGSDEDFALLADHSGLPTDSEALVNALCERYGVRWAVLTRGADGAVAAGPEGVVSVPSPPTTVVDTIGAGDTFMAGLLDALAREGLGLAAALDRGVRAAALVCEREGADPPTRAELDAASA
ncbi:MAG: carbohydrate kinase [Propionibacteriaceae bacterium]|nr:carbohydrate kinase [Propionibacteriaceae bacterium]